MSCTDYKDGYCCGGAGPCQSPDVPSDYLTLAELAPDQSDSDAQIIDDMHKQLAEKDEEIFRCWEEIRELQMTAWQRFKRWLKGEWETDERIRLF